MQVVVLIWQKEGCRSQATLDLVKTILANAAGVAGHELMQQMGQMGLAQDCWKAANDTALASGLLLGLQAHQHCSIDQLQAQWAHQ